MPPNCSYCNLYDLAAIAGIAIPTQTLTASQ
jgi:hypothetical protein